MTIYKNIPGILYLVYSNSKGIHGIYQKYIWCISDIFQFKRIYMVYTWNIPRIYPTHDYLVHMTGIHLLKYLWVCYTRYIPWLSGYVTGTEQTHKCFRRYIPVIWTKWSWVGYILGMFQVNTMYILHDIYIYIYIYILKYIWYIPDIY